MNWLIDGYKKLQERGLEPSPAVRAAIDGYKYNSDKIAQFFDEVMIPTPDGEERTAAVRQEYEAWCKRNGYRAEGTGNFVQALIASDASLDIVRRRPRDGGSVTTLLLGYILPNRGYYEQQTFDEMLDI